jgi:hypothetical protein
VDGVAVEDPDEILAFLDGVNGAPVQRVIDDGLLVVEAG